MNYKEFAGKIRAKYPGSYDDLDDMTLAKSIVDKYPVEYSDVKFDDPKKESGYKVPEIVKKTAQTLMTPVRGFRGIGVGTQKLLKNIPLRNIVPGGAMTPTDVMNAIKNVPEALQRSAEATKPGFVPLPGEQTGAALGEMAGFGGLTAPLAAINPATTLGKTVYGALTAGGLSTAQDISEEGKISPLKTGINTAIGGGIPLVTSPTAKKLAGKLAGQFGKIQSGVPAASGERLFNDPGALFSPSEQKAAEKLVAFRERAGLKKVPETVKEIVSPEAGEARKYVQDISKQYALNKLGRAEPVTGSQLLKTKQSLNKIIEVTPLPQKETRAGLFELKNKVEQVLEKAAPGEKGESLEYARSALASKFRKLFPVTAKGDISLTRTVGVPAMQGGLLKDAGILAAAPLVVAQSPMLGGATIATAGGINKVIGDIAKNPIAKQVVSSGIQQVLRELSPSKAKEYLKKALKDTKGDVEKARILADERARKDGYDTSLK